MIICGDALESLRQLPDGIVQTCVTSPPYYGLRDYGVTGQIGLEQTPEEFITRLVDVFREVRRVLRDDGTLWVNMGDSYATNQKGGGGIKSFQTSNMGSLYGVRKVGMGDAKEKDLLGIPWMLAFALRADGWYLRSDIIWAKPNPMPESVTDRPTKSHEYMFLLSKRAQYYYDAEAVKEASINTASTPRFGGNKYGDSDDPKYATKSGNEYIDDGTRNKRSVWTVATKPYSGAHFATFPRELIVPCILAGTSEKGACEKCGAPWVRVTEKTGEFQRRWSKNNHTDSPYEKQSSMQNQYTTVGWGPTCDCGEMPVPQIVLDPFGGAGTTAKTAQELGRKYIIIELNEKYVSEIIKPRLLATNVPLKGF